MKANKIISLTIIILVAFTGCNFQPDYSHRFIGAWQVELYSNEGQNQTIQFFQNHKDYVIYLNPANSFTEQWYSPDGQYITQGTWTLSNNLETVYLVDESNGERKLMVEDPFWLTLKKGSEKWTFRKF